MVDYYHHVPGRLRIRSKTFRFNEEARRKSLHQVRAMPGVTGCRMNHKAGSIIVQYEQDVVNVDQIIRNLHFPEVIKSPAVDTQGASVAQKSSQKDVTKEWKLPKEVGKIAFNVLVSKGVTASLNTLLKARM